MIITKQDVARHAMLHSCIKKVNSITPYFQSMSNIVEATATNWCVKRKVLTTINTRKDVNKFIMDSYMFSIDKFGIRATKDSAYGCPCGEYMKEIFVQGNTQFLRKLASHINVYYNTPSNRNLIHVINQYVHLQKLFTLNPSRHRVPIKTKLPRNIFGERDTTKYLRLDSTGFTLVCSKNSYFINDCLEVEMVILSNYKLYNCCIKALNTLYKDLKKRKDKAVIKYNRLLSLLNKF